MKLPPPKDPGLVTDVEAGFLEVLDVVELLFTLDLVVLLLKVLLGALKPLASTKDGAVAANSRVIATSKMDSFFHIAKKSPRGMYSQTRVPTEIIRLCSGLVSKKIIFFYSL